LGIALKIPNGYYGRIASRSGLALYHNIHVIGGVIDADYTGNIGVILLNCSSVIYDITEGDRIAQILFEKILNPSFVEVENFAPTSRGCGTIVNPKFADEVNDPFSRGNSGFGSTGK
jgi:dUTP pyrophosphatase